MSDAFKIDKDTILALSEKYADEQNSAYVNDYNGFTEGFLKCLEMLNKDVANVSNSTDTPALNLAVVSKSYSYSDVRNIVLEMHNTAITGLRGEKRFELQRKFSEIKERWKLNS